MARRSPRKKSGLPAQPRPKAPPPVRSTGDTGGDQRRRLLIWGAGVVVLVAAAVLAVVLTRGGSSTARKMPQTIPWGQLGPLQTGPPPWNSASAQLTDRLAPLGLSQLGTEGTALHIHMHLDLYVKGKKVVVPPGIGIYDNSYLTELHTHDTRGVIHVESPHVSTFRLGQLFGEWGVKLTSRCVGSYCGALSWWVNGKKQTGDPAQLALAAHQEIVIALGPPPPVVPKSYAFASGE